jgi:PAS domain-containing protein
VTKLILRLERLPEASSPPAVNGAGSRPRHVVDLGDHGRAPAASTPLSRWIAAVSASHDACLVLDRDGLVVSLSAAASELLACPDGCIGRRLLDVVDVVDFDTGVSSPDYASRIAPLAVLSTGTGLMRSLLRVRQADGIRVTVDAASAPIHDAVGDTIGSFTFLAPVRF